MVAPRCPAKDAARLLAEAILHDRDKLEGLRCKSAFSSMTDLLLHPRDGRDSSLAVAGKQEQTEPRTTRSGEL
ncbi:MAG: hypothetical protein K6U02_07040 [Firmicutes bacterium]|nr:hypothetical protein [Bacillota bacterium]